MSHKCPTCKRNIPDSFTECPLCAKGVEAPIPPTSLGVQFLGISYGGGKRRLAGPGAVEMRPDGIMVSGAIFYGKRHRVPIDGEKVLLKAFKGMMKMLFPPLGPIMYAAGDRYETVKLPAENLLIPVQDIDAIYYDPRLQRFVISAWCQPTSTTEKALYCYYFSPNPDPAQREGPHETAAVIKRRYPDKFRRASLPKYGWRTVLAATAVWTFAILVVVVVIVAFANT